MLFHAKESDWHQIVVFLLLAFLLPLICILLIMYTPLRGSSIFSFILFGVEAATPSLAAVLTVLYFRAGHGLGQFLKRCYINHFSVKTILICSIFPVVVVGVSKLVYSLAFGITPTFGVLTSKKILIVCSALIAEELGWRGFLQEKLGTYLNKFLLPLVVGIIWAAWHYHFFISGTMQAPTLFFVLGCITDSYVYFAITKAANGNIVPVSVVHFLENLCFNLFLISPEYNKGSTVPYLLYIIISIIVMAIVLLITFKRRRKDLTV
jgi:membrane protease YdiL (CAAX protease family)